jgi:catechol-2,3-dioxygenase
MHQRVRARNDTGLIQCVDHGNSWSLYFRDPEANRIEVYTDTPWHIAQPYLEPLDLDLSDAEITRRTEQHMVGNPSKQNRADWVAAFAEEIRTNHAAHNQA